MTTQKVSGHDTLDIAWVKGYGSSGTLQARLFLKRARMEWPTRPPHVAITAFDTADQARHPEAPMLSKSEFINLSGGRRTQLELRAAHRHPHYGKYITAGMTGLTVGEGAGALAPIARFHYERNLPRIRAVDAKVMARFSSQGRLELAERANEHPLLRRQNLTISVESPIHVVCLVNLGGGTGSVFLRDAMRTKHQLDEAGIPARFSAIVTPLAMGQQGIDVARKRVNGGARMIELAEDNAGESREVELSETEVLICDGRIFESVFVLPEPGGRLDDAHRTVAAFLDALLCSPIGKHVARHTVDMIPHTFSELGPFQQPKFVSLVNSTRIRPAAPDDVARCAESHLGANVLAPSGEDCPPSSLLGEKQLTLAKIESHRPKLEAGPIPSAVTTANAKTFLTNVGRSLRKEGHRQAHENSNVIAGVCRAVVQTLPDVLEETCKLRGIGMAVRVAIDVRDQVHRLRAAVAEQQFSLARPTSTEGPLTEQLAHVREMVNAEADNDYYEIVLNELKVVLAKIAKIISEYSDIDTAIAALRSRYESARGGRHTSQGHALLSETAIAEKSLVAAPECRERIKRVLMESIESRHDPQQLCDRIETIVREYAGRLSHLDNFDAAFSEGGEDAKLAVLNAMAAAEPSSGCRIVADWDPARHCSQQTFTTFEEGHPIIQLLEHRNRNVSSISAGTSVDQEKLILNIDYGVEMSAMVGVREMAEAMMSAKETYSPFPIPDHVPRVDILVPPPEEWYPRLAIPLHLLLQTGVVTKEPMGPWRYGDVPLGSTHSAASASLLAERRRSPDLPSLAALSDEIRRLLVERRTSEDVTHLLEGVIETLTAYLSDRPPADVRLVLQLERAAARSLLKMHLTEIERDSARAKHFGRRLTRRPHQTMEPTNGHSKND